MSDTTSNKVYDRLAPVMELSGATVSPEEFHERVNVVFHDYESECYDEIHKDMWASLPSVFDRLAEDVLDKSPALSGNLRLVDVGCGTGLSTELLLRTGIGQYFREVLLVDTSAKMLEKCASRISHWDINARLYQGTIDDLDAGAFDFILISSVLHHIPDLDGFLSAIQDIHAPGGFLLHIQDPNADAIGQPALEKRERRYATLSKRRMLPRWMRRFTPSRILNKVRRTVRRDGDQLGTYIDRVNHTLLAEGIITKPMTATQLWSVTDVHVPNRYGISSGISLDYVRSRLNDYELIAARSYSFFGTLRSNLPAPLLEEENAMLDSGSLEGAHLAAVWRKPQGSYRSANV